LDFFGMGVSLGPTDLTLDQTPESHNVELPPVHVPAIPIDPPSSQSQNGSFEIDPATVLRGIQAMDRYLHDQQQCLMRAFAMLTDPVPPQLEFPTIPQT